MHITLENEQLHVEDFNNKWKLFIYGFAFLHALIIFSYLNCFKKNLESICCPSYEMNAGSWQA